MVFPKEPAEFGDPEASTLECLHTWRYGGGGFWGVRHRTFGTFSGSRTGLRKNRYRDVRGPVL